jgi:hypothetical protein
MSDPDIKESSVKSMSSHSEPIAYISKSRPAPHVAKQDPAWHHA